MGTSATFSVDLLLRVLQATPEELAVIESILDGQDIPGRQKGALGSLGQTPNSPPAGRAALRHPDFRHYSLRREAACWVLVFKGGSARLNYEVGLAYAAYLLSLPDELVPSAKLFARFARGRQKNFPITELPDPETGLLEPLTDGVGIGQVPPDEDEAEARSVYYGKLCEYRVAKGNLALPESERAEAQRAYDDLLAFLDEHYRPVPSRGYAVTKTVHRAIRRLCDNLKKALPGEETPDPAKLAFAEYITEHILLPSRRYTRAVPGARVRIARGELAGRLIFECPPEDRWSVQL